MPNTNSNGFVIRWLTIFLLDKGMRLLLRKSGYAFKICCVLWKCMKLHFEWHYLIYNFHNAFSKGSCIWSRIPIHILSCLVEPRLLLFLDQSLSQQCWPSVTRLMLGGGGWIFIIWILSLQLCRNWSTAIHWSLWGTILAHWCWLNVNISRLTCLV